MKTKWVTINGKRVEKLRHHKAKVYRPKSSHNEAKTTGIHKRRTKKVKVIQPCDLSHYYS